MDLQNQTQSKRRYSKVQEKGKFSCNYCQTREQLDDIFTKTFPREKFWCLREGIGVVKQMH